MASILLSTIREKIINMKYILKIWLFTTIASPILFWAILLPIIKSEKVANIPLVFPILFATIIFGLILSLPTVLLIWVSNYILISKKIGVSKIKMMFSILTIIGIITTFLIIDESVFYNFRASLLPLSYLVVVNSSIWFLQSNELPTAIESVSLAQTNKSKKIN